VSMEQLNSLIFQNLLIVNKTLQPVQQYNSNRCAKMYVKNCRPIVSKKLRSFFDHTSGPGKAFGRVCLKELSISNEMTFKTK